MIDTIYNNSDNIIFVTSKDIIWMRNLPTVATNPITARRDNSVIGHGAITDTGGENATRTGFCYVQSLTLVPTILDSVVYTDGDFGIEAFLNLIEGLTKDLPYRIRAYSVNSVGVGYGSVITIYVAGLFRDSIYPEKLREIIDEFRIKEIIPDKRIKEVLCTPINLQRRYDMPLEFSSKQSYEEYYCVFNFARVITPSTTILSTMVKVVDESGTDVTTTLIDESKTTISGTKIYIWVRAGSEQNYLIAIKITMSNSEKFEQDATLPVFEVEEV